MAKLAMISQSISGKTREDILNTHKQAIEKLTELGYEVVNPLITDKEHSVLELEEHGVVQIPLYFLATSLDKMSLCHAVFFCKDWEDTKECKIEHDIALAYGVEIIYEEWF